MNSIICLMCTFMFVSRRELDFMKTTHLHNNWNENRPVKIGRDGQVLNRIQHNLIKDG
jgi:hypothetical protein